jgi:hypothetical protein
MEHDISNKDFRNVMKTQISILEYKTTVSSKGRKTMADLV